MKIESKRFLSGGEEILECRVEMCTGESFKHNVIVNSTLLDAIQHTFLAIFTSLQTAPHERLIFSLCEHIEESMKNYITRINEKKDKEEK